VVVVVVEVVMRVIAALRTLCRFFCCHLPFVLAVYENKYTSAKPIEQPIMAAKIAYAAWAALS
jgi:hypothetical protein